MTTMQIRNVPEPIYRTLKERAALAGLRLNDYLLVELDRLVAIPAEPEMAQQFRTGEPVVLSTSSAELIRQHRDGA